MKKLIFPIVIVVLLLVVGGSACTSYNGLVTADEDVKATWAQVENVYQRRADLIPNLVEVVKGYAAHEKETLEGVVNARAKATSTNINVDNLDPAAIQKFQAAQDGLSSALSKLMVVVERYPDLKANQNFLQLQAQLEGTENRITVEREKYIASEKAFNSRVRKFPGNIWAGIFGFDVREQYEAISEDAEVAPKVEF